jgi:general secretion pathway protein G
MKNRAGGFTLIELLVVMSIIALLLSIALPRYFNSLDRAREQVLKENLRLLRISIDRFQADKGHYPASLGELVSEKYLKSVPLDPITESIDWKLTESTEAGQEGIADVHAGAPGHTHDGTPFEAL